MCIYTYQIAYGVSGDTHARIQEFSSGGGGGPGPSDKTSSDKGFFSPQHSLQNSNG